MFDIFIRRPVLAIVISLLIFLGGLRAITMLDVRQYPFLQTSTITITTTYPGADAETMRGFVSQPIENAVSATEGIDYLTSSSAQSVSTITVFMRLNSDPNQALTDVLTELQQVRSVLPTGIVDPVVKKSSGRSFAALYLSLTSKTMTPGADHRLCFARHHAPAFGRQRRIENRHLWRPYLRHAGLARPGEAGSIRSLDRRCRGGPAGQ